MSNATTTNGKAPSQDVVADNRWCISGNGLFR